MQHDAYPGPFTVSSGQVVSGKVAAESEYYYILNGGTAESIVFGYNDTIIVSAGGLVSAAYEGVFDDLQNHGTVISATLGDRAVLIDSAGATDQDATVLAGGDISADSGGISLDARILSGGQQYATSEGIASGTTVQSGGILYAVDGTATGTIVQNGGEIFLDGFRYDGGPIGSGIIVESGGFAEIIEYAIVGHATANSGAQIVVSGGGELRNSIIQAGGTLVLAPDGSYGGYFQNVELASGATEILLGSGTQSGIVADPGSLIEHFSVGVQTSRSELISAGNVLSDFALTSGQSATVYSGGVISGITLVGESFATVSAGGSAVATQVQGGAELEVFSGTASFTTVSHYGDERIYAGTSTSALILSGGTQQAQNTGVASNTVILSGGDQELVSGGGAVDTIISAGGVLTIFSNSKASSVTVHQGGSIDLLSFPYVVGGTTSLSPTDLLTISEGGRTYKLQLQGNYAGEQFHLSRDHGSGTLVTLSAAATASANAVAAGELLASPALQTDTPVHAGGTAFALPDHQAAAEMIAAHVVHPF